VKNRVFIDRLGRTFGFPPGKMIEANKVIFRCLKKQMELGTIIKTLLDESELGKQKIN
jgi:hypothetical protein